MLDLKLFSMNYGRRAHQDLHLKKPFYIKRNIFLIDIQKSSRFLIFFIR